MRNGITVRLREWSEMRKLVETVNNAYPILSVIGVGYTSDLKKVAVLS